MITGRGLRGWLTSRGFRVAFGVGLLAVLFTQIDLRAMAAAIAEVRPEPLALLIVLVLGTRLIGAFRWYVLLRGLHQGVSYLGIVRLTFVSDFMGYFAPGNLGVEAMRLYGMSRTTSDPALAATSMLIERMVASLALIILVLAGLALKLPGIPHEIRPLAWLGLALLVVALAALTAPPVQRATLWLLSHPRLARVRGATQKVYRRLDQYRARPALLAGVFMISVFFQLCRCAIVWVGALAFGVHLPVLVYVVIVPVIFLITLLPVSIAGLGVREVGFVYLFGQVGMPAEIALSVSLLIRLVNVLLATPGAWFFARRGVLA
jgi:uncharacterized protein (TIRG00374 family)